jgi:hypothetical protein
MEDYFRDEVKWVIAQPGLFNKGPKHSVGLLYILSYDLVQVHCCSTTNSTLQRLAVAYFGLCNCTFHFVCLMVYRDQKVTGESKELPAPPMGWQALEGWAGCLVWWYTKYGIQGVP